GELLRAEVHRRRLPLPAPLLLLRRRGGSLGLGGRLLVLRLLLFLFFLLLRRLRPGSGRRRRLLLRRLPGLLPGRLPGLLAGLPGRFRRFRRRLLARERLQLRGRAHHAARPRDRGAAPLRARRSSSGRRLGGPLRAPRAALGLSG